MDTQRGGLRQLAGFPGDTVLEEKQPDGLPVRGRRVGLLVCLGLFRKGISAGFYAGIEALEAEAIRRSVGRAGHRPRTCQRFRMRRARGDGGPQFGAGLPAESFGAGENFENRRGPGNWMRSGASGPRTGGALQELDRLRRLSQHAFLRERTSAGHFEYSPDRTARRRVKRIQDGLVRCCICHQHARTPR